MRCPDEQTIVDFVEHRLASDERARIDGHLDACVRCQVAAAELCAAFGSREHDDAFAERYRLLHVLGSGAMGVVYAAFDRVLERRVAVKVLRRPKSKHAGLGRTSERGLREARALARLSHPNIVEVFDVGWCSNGLYIAMKLVEGRTLRQWWTDAPRRWQEIVALMCDAAAALAAAHAHGIVHRDFKPDNVMVSQGRLEVLDFGLARHEDTATTMPSSAAESGDDRLTRTGYIVGTPAYLAPECHDSGRADPRSDQYAFFVTLFEALCDTRPFVAASLAELEVLKRRGLEPDGVAWPSHVPRWLRAVVARGLSPDPADRFASMDEVGRALRRGQTRRVRGAVAIGSIASVGAALAVLLSDPRTPCERTRDALGEVWNDARRTIVSRSLLERAPAREPELVGALDAYATEWTAAYVELCAATSGEPRANEAWATCLLARRAALDELAALLVDPDVDPADPSVSGQSLPTLAACTDAEADGDPPELQELLARAVVLERSGRYDELAPFSLRIAEQARAVGAHRVEADALIRQGLALHQLDDYDAAERSFGDAYLVAVRHQRETEAAEAATYLAQLNTFDFARVDQGLAWARHAEAALVRAGEDPNRDGHLQFVLGQAMWAKGQPQEALAYYERALALTEAEGSRAVRHLDLANLLSSLQRADEAVSHYERAIELLTATRSAAHPDTTVARLNFAYSRLLAGDAQRARVLVDEAAAQMEVSQPSMHLRALERIRRAAVLEALGDPQAAVEAQREGVRLTEQTLGPAHAVVAAHRRSLAALHRAAGDCEAALEEALRARTIAESSATQQGSHLAKIRWEQAAALRCLGRADEAAREESAAIALLEATDPSAPELAQWRREAAH